MPAKLDGVPPVSQLTTFRCGTAPGERERRAGSCAAFGEEASHSRLRLGTRASSSTASARALLMPCRPSSSSASSLSVSAASRYGGRPSIRTATAAVSVPAIGSPLGSSARRVFCSDCQRCRCCGKRLRSGGLGGGVATPSVCSVSLL
eukprot:TRINITY_DN23478_c0_g1_i1.p2 TRINITY_DN23478_c0_g1~~TRINITY_DN23478_c0_g1_i1.p2  ORF type:complete len:148 (+),score=23.09 TRINITY_DN23478_c0_g1_i1:66-509(+)